MNDFKRAVSAVLSSADTAEQRAEIIVAFLGIDIGDPAIIARHKAEIAALLQQYMEIDREARR